MALCTRGDEIVLPPGLPLRPIIEGSLLVGSAEIGALDEDQFVGVTLRLEYSASAGRYEVAEFGIDRGPVPLEVNSAFIRTARVQQIARLAVIDGFPEWAQMLMGIREERALAGDGLHARIEGRRVTPQILLAVAAIYRIAEISNENPARAVEQVLAIKQRTATNWISRARAAGHMTKTSDPAAVRAAAEALGIEIRGFDAMGEGDRGAAADAAQ